MRITSFRWFYAGNFRNGNLRLYTVLVLILGYDATSLDE